MFDNGVVITCSSVFGHRTVNIYVPPAPGPGEIVEAYYCWCTNYFTEGVVTEVIGDYGSVGDYGDEVYPNYCNSDDMAVKNYNGIRYRASLCQAGINTGNSTSPGSKSYICVPSDFAQYEVGDKIIAFMRGVWTYDEGEEIWSFSDPVGREPGISCINSETGTCDACEGTVRPERTGNEADGSYLIVPLRVSS